MIFLFLWVCSFKKNPFYLDLRFLKKCRFLFLHSICLCWWGSFKQSELIGDNILKMKKLKMLTKIRTRCRRIRKEYDSKANEDYSLERIQWRRKERIQRNHSLKCHNFNESATRSSTTLQIWNCWYKQGRESTHSVFFFLSQSHEFVQWRYNLKLCFLVQPAAERLINLNIYPFDLTPQLAQDIKTLWKDEAIQKTFQRSNEFQLLDSAP